MFFYFNIKIFIIFWHIISDISNNTHRCGSKHCFDMSGTSINILAVYLNIVVCNVGLESISGSKTVVNANQLELFDVASTVRQLCTTLLFPLRAYISAIAEVFIFSISISDGKVEIVHDLASDAVDSSLTSSLLENNWFSGRFFPLFILGFREQVWLCSISCRVWSHLWLNISECEDQHEVYQFHFCFLNL